MYVLLEFYDESDDVFEIHGPFDTYAEAWKYVESGFGGVGVFEVRKLESPVA